jgi:hypothetical protein
MAKRQRIRTKPSYVPQGNTAGLMFTGWLSGRGSYLRITDANDNVLGTLYGQSLYRLAKAIVIRYEADAKEA